MFDLLTSIYHNIFVKSNIQEKCSFYSMLNKSFQFFIDNDIQKNAGGKLLLHQIFSQNLLIWIKIWSEWLKSCAYKNAFSEWR